MAGVQGNFRIGEKDRAITAYHDELARYGWRVVSQSSSQPSSGVGRTLALGVMGVGVFKPSVKSTVVFGRIQSPAGQS